MERRVDLDRVEDLAVEVEGVGRRQTRRIKRAQPVGKRGPALRAETKLRNADSVAILPAAAAGKRAG